MTGKTMSDDLVRAVVSAMEETGIVSGDEARDLARAIIPIVQADEREACATIAEMHDHRGDIATAIRERNGRD